MMGFADFVLGRKKYVSLRYDGETQVLLRRWATDNGFDLTVKWDGTSQDASEFDFHTTVFFTTSRHHGFRPHEFVMTDAWTPARATGFDLLGENKDIPVLKVQGEAISHYRASFARAGFQDQGPEYRPHVSLSYAKRDYSDIYKLRLPTFPLVFGSLVVKDQT